MIKNFWEECKDILIDAIKQMKGSDRCIVVARIAQVYGKGGQTFVA